MKKSKGSRTYTLHFRGSILGEMESRKIAGAVNMLIDEGVRHLVLDISQVELVNTPGALFLAEMRTMFESIRGSFKVTHAGSRHSSSPTGRSGDAAQQPDSLHIENRR